MMLSGGTAHLVAEELKQRGEGHYVETPADLFEASFPAPMMSGDATIAARIAIWADMHKLRVEFLPQSGRYRITNERSSRQDAVRPRRGILELARDSVDNQLRNGRTCPNDTDDDGDCGRPMCPVCGTIQSHRGKP